MSVAINIMKDSHLEDELEKLPLNIKERLLGAMDVSDVTVMDLRAFRQFSEEKMGTIIEMVETELADLGTKVIISTRESRPF